MVSGNGKPCVLSCVGMFLGMLLLTFAVMLVMLASPAFLHSAVSQRSPPRRLTGPGAAAFIPAAAGGLAIPAPTFTTTTSGYPSSLDSSDSSSSGSSLEFSKSSESNSLRASGLRAERLWVAWGTAGGATVTQLLIMIVFAILYNEMAVQPILEAKGTLRAMNLADSGNDDFDNGICECWSDKWVCIHGWCCPLVRMAHTNAAAGVCGFWESVFCWCCCAFMSVGLGPCCLMVYWRQRLKEIMNIRDHALNDYCLTLFCPYLSVCQQGTAVDTKLGYQVVGCCDLEWNNDC